MNNQHIDGMMFNMTGKPDSYALEDLLTCVMPDQDPTPEGGMAWGVQARGYFDALFYRFGLTMSSTDPRFKDDKYVADLWYRCVGIFGTFIEAADLWPAIFERRLAEWEPGFVSMFTQPDGFRRHFDHVARWPS
jgi:hypothetical protein